MTLLFATALLILLVAAVGGTLASREDGAGEIEDKSSGAYLCTLRGVVSSISDDCRAVEVDITRMGLRYCDGPRRLIVLDVTTGKGQQVIENVGLGDTVEATYWPQFKDEDPLPANSIVNVDDLPHYAR